MNNKIGDIAWISSFYDAAAGWWGESWYEGEGLEHRLEIVKRYANITEKRILELAAGTGETAAFLCDHGYTVVAVDISHNNFELMSNFQKKQPNLQMREGDILEVDIQERFPTVCMFESFGFGSDQEQQRLLKRISENWLIPDGVLILDVYHPMGPILAAGKKQELDKLENVAGSMDMTDYSYYDPIKSRWIDIWEPKNEKENKRMQSIRCYTPADFILLAGSCGLSIEKMIFCDKEIDFENPEVTTENVFTTDEGSYSYTVILRKLE